MAEGIRNETAHHRRGILRANLEHVQSLCEIVDKEYTLKKLEKVVQETEELIMGTNAEEKVTNQEEIVLDSEIMSTSSKVIDHCVNTLTESLNRTYNPAEFTKKLVKYVRNLQDEDQMELEWSVLETEISKYFKSMPLYSTLPALGIDTPIEHKVKERKQIIREAQVPIKRPAEVLVTNKMESNVEETVLKIHKLICNYYKSNSKPLSYFRLVLNPTDFGKMVENMLHMAYLVRDGTVMIVKDESNELVIKLCNDEKKSKKKQTNIQSDMFLNMEIWKALRSKYSTMKPLIQ